MVNLKEIVNAVRELTSAINNLTAELRSAKSVLNHPKFTEKEDSE